MTKVIITGSRGFIGRNLVAHLIRDAQVQLFGFDLGQPLQDLEVALADADIVFHLAGVNRPESVQEFTTGNVAFTAQVCEILKTTRRAVPLVLSSSVQAEQDNPYGQSKLQAEEVVNAYAAEAQAPVIIYRLKNVFGKWCRPNYNSVVATFCHNIAHDLPIAISDPANKVALVHVDDVVRSFIAEMYTAHTAGVCYREVIPVFEVTLGELSQLLHGFREMRESLVLPDLSGVFVRKLYGTYLSYLDKTDFAYNLQQRCDMRGCLAEFVKSSTSGQIFVSTTKPGISRGNHYHHTKTEKFLVLQGEALIRFRNIENAEVLEYRVCGEDFRVVDIPPGYTHMIENVGGCDLVTLFWASEIFNPDVPDTQWPPVLPEGVCA